MKGKITAIRPEQLEIKHDNLLGRTKNILASVNYRAFSNSKYGFETFPTTFSTTKISLNKMKVSKSL